MEMPKVYTVGKKNIYNCTHTHTHTHKGKIPRNKLNQRGERPVLGTLSNTDERD